MEGRTQEGIAGTAIILQFVIADAEIVEQCRTAQLLPLGLLEVFQGTAVVTATEGRQALPKGGLAIRCSLYGTKAEQGKDQDISEYYCHLVVVMTSP